MLESNLLCSKQCQHHVEEPMIHFGDAYQYYW